MSDGYSSLSVRTYNLRWYVTEEMGASVNREIK
jgi:hypothetical protein